MELPKVLPPSIPKIASYIRYHCLWVAEVFDHVTRHTWSTAPSSITRRPNLPLPVKLPSSPEPNIPTDLSSGLSLLFQSHGNDVDVAGTDIPAFQKFTSCHFAFRKNLH